MEPFQASKWNPGRRTCTRSGDPVRVLCVDGPSDDPVVGIFNLAEMGDVVHQWSASGVFNVKRLTSDLNLFFADNDGAPRKHEYPKGGGGDEN